MCYLIIVGVRTWVFYFLFNKSHNLVIFITVHFKIYDFKIHFCHLLNCPYMSPLFQDLNMMKIKTDFLLVSLLLIYTCNLTNCMKRKNREGKWLIRNCFYAYLKNNKNLNKNPYTKLMNYKMFGNLWQLNLLVRINYGEINKTNQPNKQIMPPTLGHL